VHGVVVRVVLMNDHETRKRATDRDVALHFGVDTWKALQEHEIKIAVCLPQWRNPSLGSIAADWPHLSTSKKDLDRLPLEASYL